MQHLLAMFFFARNLTERLDKIRVPDHAPVRQLQVGHVLPQGVHLHTKHGYAPRQVVANLVGRYKTEKEKNTVNLPQEILL
jgi:hypothetical protein